MKRAIVFPAYNRPEYFEDMLSSLQSCPLFRSLDVYCFLDNGGDEAVRRMTSIWRKHTAVCEGRVELRVRSKRVGCGLNLIGMREYMFKHTDVDEIIQVEEDVRLNRYSLPTLLSLRDRLAELFPDKLTLPVLHSWCAECPNEDRKVRRAWKVERAHLLKPSETFLVALFSRATYSRISSGLLDYANTFLEPHRHEPDGYSKRDHAAIRAFFKERYGQTIEATGQDACIDVLVRRYGIKAVSPVVNTTIYIGEQGIHGDRATFERLGAHRMSLELIGDVVGTEIRCRGEMRA